MSHYFTFDVDSGYHPPAAAAAAAAGAGTVQPSPLAADSATLQAPTRTYQLLSPTSSRTASRRQSVHQIPCADSQPNASISRVADAATPLSTTAPLPARTSATADQSNSHATFNTLLHTTTNAARSHSNVRPITVSETADSTINLISMTESYTEPTIQYTELIGAPSTQTSPQLTSTGSVLFESLPSSVYDNTIIQLSPIASPAISRDGSSIYQPHAGNAASTLFCNSSRALSNTFRHPVLATSQPSEQSSSSALHSSNSHTALQTHSDDNTQTEPATKRRRVSVQAAGSGDASSVSQVAGDTVHQHTSSDSSDTCTECQRDYPTCIICQDILVQARQYSCHRHMACLRCINADIDCKLQPSFSPFSFNVDQKQFILQGTTHCPVCRSSDTAVTAELNTVYELPKEAQAVMFKAGKLYTCAFCDIQPDTYTSISAHGTKCTGRKLTCPECKQSFTAVNGFTHHVLNDCSAVPCPHYSCGQKGTYQFARSHAQYHDSHNKLRTGLDRIARAAGAYDLSTIEAVLEANQRIGQILAQLNGLSAVTPRVLQPSRSDVTSAYVTDLENEPLYEHGEAASEYLMRGNSNGSSAAQSPEVSIPRRSASLHGILQRQQIYRNRVNTRSAGPRHGTAAVHQPQLLASHNTRSSALPGATPSTSGSGQPTWQQVMLNQLQRAQHESAPADFDDVDLPRLFQPI